MKLSEFMERDYKCQTEDKMSLSAAKYNLGGQSVIAFKKTKFKCKRNK